MTTSMRDLVGRSETSGRSTDLDVVAVGELNPDVVLARITADAPVLGTEQEARDFAFTLGSSNAICLAGLQRLGARTALVARVGDDPFGHWCRAMLAGTGVESTYVRIDPSVPTGVTVSLAYAEDRLLTTFLGAMAELDVDDVPDAALERARHLHVGSLFLQRGLLPGLGALFERAKARGLSVSLDTGWDPAEIWDENVLVPLLAHVDVLLPNAKELRAMSRRDEEVDAARWALDHGVGCVVLKRGAEGATVWWSGGAASHGGFVVDTVDTTGAGDSFDAGFLWGFLSEGTPDACLRLGNACGALSASAVGGTGGFEGRRGVVAFLRARGDATTLA